MSTTDSAAIGRNLVHTQPWTCAWGEFEGYVKRRRSPAVDVPFWRCSHPTRGSEVGPLGPGVCERCPHWERARRIRTAGGP